MNTIDSILYTHRELSMGHAIVPTLLTYLLSQVLAQNIYQRQMMNYSAWLKHLIVSICGAIYIIVLVAVNLVGYAVGIGGLQALLSKLNTYNGLIVLCLVFYFLAIGVSIMEAYDQFKTQSKNHQHDNEE